MPHLWIGEQEHIRVLMRGWGGMGQGAGHCRLLCPSLAEGIFNPCVPPEECVWLPTVVQLGAAGWDWAGSGARLHDGVFSLNAFQPYLKYLWLVFSASAAHAEMPPL